MLRIAEELGRWGVLGDGAVVLDDFFFFKQKTAYEIAVPVRPVHAPDRRPHLVLAGRGGGGSRPLPRGGAVPLVGGDVLQRVGGVGEQVVAGGFATLPDLPDLLPDRGQRVTEAGQPLPRF